MTIIRVIDFETTGFEPPESEVCEVGMCDMILEDDGKKTVAIPKAWMCGVRSMPPEARSIHHIALSDCEGRGAFDADLIFREPTVHVADRVHSVAAIAAHNSEFETKFFASPVPVICTYKAALRVWPDAPGHSNGTLRYWLEDAGKITITHAATQPAHRAGPDAYVTAHILAALLETGATGREMVAWTKEPRLLPTCPLGKFRGKPWPEVEGGFLGWMLRQPTMEADLKWNAQREIERRTKENNNG